MTSQRRSSSSDRPRSSRGYSSPPASEIEERIIQSLERCGARMTSQEFFNLYKDCCDLKTLSKRKGWLESIFKKAQASPHFLSSQAKSALRCLETDAELPVSFDLQKPEEYEILMCFLPYHFFVKGEHTKKHRDDSFPRGTMGLFYELFEDVLRELRRGPTPLSEAQRLFFAMYQRSQKDFERFLQICKEEAERQATFEAALREREAAAKSQDAAAPSSEPQASPPSDRPGETAPSTHTKAASDEAPPAQTPEDAAPPALEGSPASTDASETLTKPTEEATATAATQERKEETPRLRSLGRKTLVESRPRRAGREDRNEASERDDRRTKSRNDGSIEDVFSRVGEASFQELLASLFDLQGRLRSVEADVQEGQERLGRLESALEAKQAEVAVWKNKAEEGQQYARTMEDEKASLQKCLAEQEAHAELHIKMKWVDVLGEPLGLLFELLDSQGEGSDFEVIRDEAEKIQRFLGMEPIGKVGETGIYNGKELVSYTRKDALKEGDRIKQVKLGWKLRGLDGAERVVIKRSVVKLQSRS